MGFIEALLEDIAEVSAAEMIDVATEKWGEVDYSFDEGAHSLYPQFINDLLYIAYFDKEVQLNGLEYYVLHCDRYLLRNTVNAFRKINDEYDADLLQQVLEMAEILSYYDSKIDFLSDEASCKLKLLETVMYFNLDYTNMWDLLEQYVEKGLYSYSLHTRNGFKN